jgi:hypothetical protein
VEIRVPSPNQSRLMAHVGLALVEFRPFQPLLPRHFELVERRRVAVISDFPRSAEQPLRAQNQRKCSGPSRCS